MENTIKYKKNMITYRHWLDESDTYDKMVLRRGSFACSKYSLITLNIIYIVIFSNYQDFELPIDDEYSLVSKMSK